MEVPPDAEPKPRNHLTWFHVVVASSLAGALLSATTAEALSGRPWLVLAHVPPLAVVVYLARRYSRRPVSRTELRLVLASAVGLGLLWRAGFVWVVDRYGWAFVILLLATQWMHRYRELPRPEPPSGPSPR